MIEVMESRLTKNKTNMYTLSSNEIKYFQGDGAKGPWKKAAFTLTDGKEVSMWGDHPDFPNLKAGASVSGDLTKGEYKGKEQWTLKPLAKPSTFAPRTSNNAAIAKNMDKKAATIEKAQDRKEESMKLAAIQRDSILLVTSFYPEANAVYENDIPGKEAYLQGRIMEWKKWLEQNYGDGQPF